MGKWNKSGVYRKNALHSPDEPVTGEEGERGINWKEIDLQESRSEPSRLDSPGGYPKGPSWSLKTEYAHEYTSPLYGADPRLVQAALLGEAPEEDPENLESPLDASAKILEEEREREEESPVQPAGQASEPAAAPGEELLRPEPVSFAREAEEAEPEEDDFMEEYPEEKEPEEELPEEDSLPEEDFLPVSDPEEEDWERQERELLAAALRQEEEEDEAVLSEPEEQDLDAFLEDTFEPLGKGREEGLSEPETSPESQVSSEPEASPSLFLDEDDLVALHAPEPEKEEVSTPEEEAAKESPEAETAKEEEAEEEAVSETPLEEEAQETPAEAEEETVSEAPLEEEATSEAPLEEETVLEAPAEEEPPEEEDWLDDDEDWDMQMPVFEESEEEEDDLDFFSEEPSETASGEDSGKASEKESEESSEKSSEEASGPAPGEDDLFEVEVEEEEEPAKIEAIPVENAFRDLNERQTSRSAKTGTSRSGTRSRNAQVKRKTARPAGSVSARTAPAREENPGRSRFLGFMLGMALLALGTAYAAVSYYYVDHFIPGTTINGIPVGGMTAYEAEQTIAQNVENYTIQVASRNFDTQEISGSSIDYRYLSDGGVLNLMKHQNPLGWAFGYLRRLSYNTSKNVTFNKALLRSQLKSLDCAQDENQVSPQNAYITMEGSEFSIVPETQGAELKMKEAYRLLDEAISMGEREVDFTSKPGVYEEATLTADSQAINNMLDAFNNYATAKITLLFGNQKEILDGDTLKNWLEFDEKGELVQDSSVFDQHIWDYIGELAAKYDTVGTSRPLQATADGRTVYVYGYSYGWQIDEYAEFTQLQSEITQGLQVTREPNFSMRANAYWPNDIGNTYIEVDMGYQHMYYYQNGYLIFDSDFVSGNVNIPGRGTPEGIYTLYAKQSPAVLKGEIGENGKPEYETEVSFWMPFNGGIGFHDADWQPYFGYDLYLTNGSHGCINLPYYAAAQLYEIIDYGVPILCFY